MILETGYIRKLMYLSPYAFDDYQLIDRPPSWHRDRLMMHLMCGFERVADGAAVVRRLNASVNADDRRAGEQPRIDGGVIG